MPSLNIKPIKLLVVIINYFSADLVTDLVKQLNQQRLPSDFELSIICADNSANDKQRQELQKIEVSSNAELALQLNSSNLGFGRAINQCAEGQNFDFLCCINPDVTLFSDTLSSLLSYCSKHSEQGIWGGITVDEQERPDFRHAWQEPSLKNTLVWATGLSRFLRKPSWQDNYKHLNDNSLQPYSVDCVSGCCFLISRSAWIAVGGFDDSLFLYSEEVDLCRRARQSGFQPTVVSHAKLKHSRHSAEESNKRVIAIYSAKLLYASRHHGVRFNIFYKILVSAGSCLRAIKYLISGNFTAAKVWGKLAFISLFYWRINLSKNHSE